MLTFERHFNQMFKECIEENGDINSLLFYFNLGKGKFEKLDDYVIKYLKKYI